MLSWPASSGASDMEKIAIDEPNTLPDRTTCSLVAFLLMTLRYRPRLNRVQVLFRAELKLDRIAPIITAAKNPA